MRKKTHQDFVKEINEMTEGNYTVVSQYDGIDKPIKMEHNVCGLIYTTSPKNFVRTKKGNCPACGRTTKKNNNIFQKEIKKLVGNEYKFLSEYVNSRTKLRVQHNSAQCDYHEYYVKPNDFLTGRRCPKCSANKIKKHKEFVKEVNQLGEKQYKVQSQYKGRHTYVTIEHIRCERVWEVTPGNFLSGGRCPYCARDSQRLTEDEINNNLEELLGKGSYLVDEYKNNKEEVVIYHTGCNDTFTGRVDQVLQGKRKCPCMIKPRSRGEQYIEEYLKDKGIRYEREKTFEKLEYKGKLRYDFYLVDYNVLVEYQGIHHYEPTTYGGITRKEAVEKFRAQRYKDTLKEEYANNKKIPLLQPTYELDNYKDIEAYLNEELTFIRSNARSPEPKLRTEI